MLGWCLGLCSDVLYLGDLCGLCVVLLGCVGGCVCVFFVLCFGWLGGLERGRGFWIFCWIYAWWSSVFALCGGLFGSVFGGVLVAVNVWE